MKKILCYALVCIMMFVFTACRKENSLPVVNNVTDILGETSAEPLKNEDVLINPAVPNKTIGQILCEEFERIYMEEPETNIMDAMEEIRTNEEIVFMTEITTVDNTNIYGFSKDCEISFVEALWLKPTMVTIPFVAYVFVLDDDADAEVFKNNLIKCVDLKWNDTIEADEFSITNNGNYVFCVISAYYFEK